MARDIGRSVYARLTGFLMAPERLSLHDLMCALSDGSRRLFDSVQTAAMRERMRLALADAAVRVREEEWTRIESLRTAGPNDAVFEVDADHGRISFGDGVNGASLPEGAVVEVAFAEQDGNSPIVSITLKRTSAPATLDQVLWMAIRNRTSAIEFSRYDAYSDDGGRKPARWSCWLVASATFAVGWIIGGRRVVTRPTR